MGINTERWQLLLGLVAVVFASLLLGGCASNTGAGGQGDAKADLVTESDEPEGRRRARIRLELAVGYFEQGQTTVALDELKQALSADPNFGEAYNLRGLIYMRLNQIRLAEESFRRSITLNPGDANVQHNFGWLMCQQGRHAEYMQLFARALSNPQYGDRPKTLMTQGLCQIRAGQRPEAEVSLTQSYELDAGNPITGYNLANLLFLRGDFVRAQFYIRRLNNSELANAESLWLGIKVDQRLDNRDAVQQLAGQLRKRFAQSRELAAYERGAFDE